MFEFQSLCAQLNMDNKLPSRAWSCSTLQLGLGMVDSMQLGMDALGEQDVAAMEQELAQLKVRWLIFIARPTIISRTLTPNHELECITLDKIHVASSELWILKTKLLQQSQDNSFVFVHHPSVKAEEDAAARGKGFSSLTPSMGVGRGNAPVPGAKPILEPIDLDSDVEVAFSPGLGLDHHQVHPGTTTDA